MSNDKMRALLEECLEILQAENWRGDLQDGIWTVLTQQPESELKGTVGNCYGPDNKGLYRIAVFSGSPFPVGTTVYTSPQPSAQVPSGFNPLAYRRKTGEWMYVNHAGEWHLCPCPADRTLQVPEGWRAQVRRVRNYSDPDDVFEAVPVRVLETEDFAPSVAEDQ